MAVWRFGVARLSIACNIAVIIHQDKETWREMSSFSSPWHCSAMEARCASVTWQ
jgi:hypothetical protein